jgi:hypothetical protein
LTKFWKESAGEIAVCVENQSAKRNPEGILAFLAVANPVWKANEFFDMGDTGDCENHGAKIPATDSALYWDDGYCVVSMYRPLDEEIDCEAESEHAEYGCENVSDLFSLMDDNTLPLDDHQIW